jgi:hypothetical protein
MLRPGEAHLATTRFGVGGDKDLTGNDPNIVIPSER